MDIHPLDIVLIIVHIVILFFLLRLLIWKPLYRFMQQRAASVQETLDSAKQTKEDAEQLKENYLQKLDGLEAEGRKILRDSHVRAEEEAGEVLSDARRQAQSVLDEARIKIESEKSIAVARARDEVAQLATDMAARILRREVSPGDNKVAAEDFFNESR